MTSRGAPTEDIAHVADAQRRFEAATGGLDDAAVRRPSSLPGWTVGHVLTHVARNADSHVRRADAAARGELVDQYVGGHEGRAREIEAGARRSAAELLADVHDTARRVADAWETALEPAWSVVSRDAGGRERRLEELPARRWQELEVHLVDLDIGVAYRDWPDAFVAVWLPRLRATAPDRLAPGVRVPVHHGLTVREELAWLYGRLERPDLPTLAPWG